MSKYTYSYHYNFQHDRATCVGNFYESETSPDTDDGWAIIAEVERHLHETHPERKGEWVGTDVCGVTDNETGEFRSI